MHKHKLNRYYDKPVVDYLIILVVLIIGMWQLFFCRAVMKWDMVDINLPWNYFISECINHGKLPLWNPYSRFGFPQYGDPCTWYPVNWLLGLIRQYDLYAIHLEYLLHLFLAAVGMYNLCRFYGLSRPVRLIMAVSYMFSGFFIGNAQHIWWLVNATWLPFAFLYLLKLHRDPGFTDAVKLGFVFFLMISGGYPGLFISTGYLFFIIFLILIGKYLKDRDFPAIRRFVSFSLIAVFVFLLSSLVVLVSSFDFSDYVNRGTALPYDAGGVLFGSFSPVALISLIFSYPASINNTAVWGSDFSMVNTFTGFFSLMILMFFLLSGRAPKQSIYFSAVAVIFLMIAMAEVFPFRRWLYLYIPYMDMFRFSSLFRLFVIFFFILAAGFSIEKLLTGLKIWKQFTKYIFIVIILLVAFLIILSFTIERWMFKTLVKDGFSYFDSIAGIGEKIFFQGFILLCLVCIFLFLIWKKREWRSQVLVLIIFAEIIISVQLNINATVVYPYSPQYIENHLNKLTTGFPLPSLNKSMRNSSDTTISKHIPYLWHNLGELYKTPSISSFSPYKLNTLQTAVRNKQLEAVMDQPLAFLAGSLTKTGLVDTSTVLETIPGTIQVKEFRPGHIELQVHTDTILYLALLQNYYPYWNAFIDDIRQDIIPVNNTFMAVKLLKGYHRVLFEFRSQKILTAFWISFICWILCLCVIVYGQLKKSEPSLNLHLRLIPLIVAFLALSVFIFNNRERYRLPKKMITSLIDFASGIGTDSVKTVLNVDDPSKFPDTVTNHASVLRLQQQNDLSELQRLLTDMDSEYILFVQMNTPFIAETEWLISQFYPEEVLYENFGDRYYVLRKRGYTEYESALFASTNDFETQVTAWSDPVTGLDSVFSYSGRYSNKLDSVNIYSSTYTTKISSLPKVDRNYFRITLRAKTGISADPLIVFEVKRKDKTFIWNATHLKDMMVEGDQWSKVCMVKYPYERLKADDVLKIYVWNNSRGNAWIDDFRIELIPGNGH